MWLCLRVGGGSADVQRAHGINDSRVGQGPGWKQMERECKLGSEGDSIPGRNSMAGEQGPQDDTKYAVTMVGVTLDQDTRHVLKMQTARRWHQDGRALKGTKWSIQAYKGTDWLATFSINHSNK